MKKLIYILTLLMSCTIFAQENYELTTLRIGPYKISMTAEEAEKMAGKKLKNYEEWDKSDFVVFKGEKINIKLQGIYISEQEPSRLSVYSLSTSSPKFKTKKGMGVGNTKDEIIEAYKYYPNYSVNQGWDEKTNKTSSSICYFNLSDYDAGTELSFKIVNNIVVEVNIFIDEGC